MKLSIVCASVRINALEETKASLLAQTRKPDAYYLVGKDDSLLWYNVPYVEPPWYAPEMAINASFDAAFRGHADLAVYVSDLAWLDPNALELIERYMVEHPECPMLSSVHCLHAEKTCGVVTPDTGTCIKWCGFNIEKDEAARVYKNLKALETNGFVAGAIPAALHLMSHTAIRREVLLKVN